MRPSRARRQLLLDAERAAVATLSRLAAVAAAREASTCFQELPCAPTTFHAALKRHVQPAATRRSRDGHVLAQAATARVWAASATLDHFQAINRLKRSVPVHIDGLLAESLDPEVRALLGEARVTVNESVSRCDEAIVVLHRRRELLRQSNRHATHLTGPQQD